MRKVITYGTYDLLHYGHIRLLERAKALGDYLVVGVTADGFDLARGKINVSQTLNERMEAVRALGIADEVIVEEYEGQKIDDIRRMRIDVFTVGSDWMGKFDYLKEYCEVVYLDRTEGVSSTEIRSEKAAVRLGFAGSTEIVAKHVFESAYVNGVEVTGIWQEGAPVQVGNTRMVGSFDELLAVSDAVYIATYPAKRFEQVGHALESGVHVLCESPIAMSKVQCAELFSLAASRGLILADAIKTAYSTAYHRMALLVKSGRIGRVVSVEATCTSLSDLQTAGGNYSGKWTASMAWAPTALLPILQLLGSGFSATHMVKCPASETQEFDAFGKVELVYPGAVAQATFGKAVKSEGSLVVSGTEGYVYVPAPWWKTDYFEIRKENPLQNRRFFYQLDGEGIRHELASFVRAVERLSSSSLMVDRETSETISDLIGRFADDKNCTILEPISNAALSAGEWVGR